MIATLLIGWVAVIVVSLQVIKIVLKKSNNL